ncbi:MAG: hypothetical protein AAB656_04540 [Patescibacteria group bacterium]
MQNEAAYSLLIKVILTKRDSNILIGELDVLKNSLFKTDSNAFEVVLKEEVRKKVADVIEFYISKGADKKVLIEFLDSKFRKVPTLDLTIAFDPTGAILERMSKWVRENVGEVLLDLKIDRSIVCGAIVSFGGKYNEQIPRIS